MNRADTVNLRLHFRTARYFGPDSVDESPDTPYYGVLLLHGYYRVANTSIAKLIEKTIVFIVLDKQLSDTERPLVNIHS